MRGYYTTIDVIKAYLEAHIQINTVKVGNITEVDLQKQTIYPLAQIVPGEVQFLNNTLSFGMRVIVMDSVTEFTNDPVSGSNEYDTTNNKLDVYNTQLSVVNGLQLQSKQGELFNANFQLDGEPIASPFEDEYSNLLTGWVLDFNVLIPNNEVGICEFQLDYDLSGSIPSDKYMEKIIYDTNSNGIVDNAERLGGQLPSYYENINHTHSADEVTFTPTGSISSTNVQDAIREASDLGYSDVDNLSYLNTIGVISGSSQLDGSTINSLTGSFSGSFVGDGSNLTGVTAYTDDDTRRVLNTDGVVSGSSQINVDLTTGTLDASRIVGSITASSLDYDDIFNKPSLVSGSSQIDHDLTLNYSASRHFLQSEISITESQISDLTHYTDSDVKNKLNIEDVLSGSLDNRTVDGLNLTNLSASGDFTGTFNGTAVGTVTDVTATSPISSSGGTTPNITLEPSGVVTGSYNFAYITVDEFGRVTDASNGTQSGSIDLTDVAYTNIDNHFQVDQTISGSLYVSSSITDYSKIELYKGGTLRFEVDVDGNVSGSTFTGDGSGLTGITSEVPTGTVSGSVQVVIGDTTGQLPASRVDGVITGSGEIDHNLTANYSSSRHFLQSEISITESQISDLTHYTDSDVKNKLNTDGVLSGSLTGDDITLANIGGASYTTVQQMQDVYHSTGLVTGGVISNVGAGAIQVTAGEGYIRGTNSDVSTLQAMAWPTNSSITLVDNSLNFIYIEYNSGSPRAIATTTERTDANTNLLIGTGFRKGTQIYINAQTSFDVGNHVTKMIKRLQATVPFSKESGGVITEVGARQLTVSEGTWWSGLKQFITPALNTSTGDTFVYNYRDGVGGWTEVASSTTIDNLQYDDGSGTLATLSNARYGVHWVFLGGDGTLHVVYGQTDDTLTQAESKKVPTSLPFYFDDFARLIGKIIVGKGETNLFEILSAFDTTLSGGSGIQSLLDDTTPQLGGNLDVNGFNITMSGTETVDGRDVSVDGSTLDSHIADSNIHFAQSEISITKSQISDIDGFVSGSSQIDVTQTTNYGSINQYTDADNLSYINTVGVISGSIQIDHDATTNYVAGEHFLQSAISIPHTQISDFDAGVKEKLNTDGVISGSSQIDVTQTTNYSSINQYTDSDNLSYINTVGVISGSSQIVIGNTTGQLPVGRVDGAITGSGEIDHNLTKNYTLDQHFTQAEILIDSLQVSDFFITHKERNDFWKVISGSATTGEVDGITFTNGTFSGDGSGLTGVTATLPSGVVSGSSQIDHNLTTNYSSSRHFLQSEISITESQISDLTHYTDSDTLTYINGKGVISGSSQLDGSTLDNITLTGVSASGSFSGSFFGDGSNLSGVTSYTDADTRRVMNTDGVLSGSVLDNVAYTNVDNNFTVGQTISGSLLVTGSNGSLLQVTDGTGSLSVEGWVSASYYLGDGSQLSGIQTTLPAGIVSGSSQVDHDLTTNYVAGEHFLQSEISITESQISDLNHFTVADLPSGTVSGSSQVDVTATTNYSSINQYTDADNLDYLNTLDVVSGSSNIAYTNVNNEFSSRQTITDSGSLILRVIGSTGELFKVDDVNDGDVLRVNNSAGSMLLNVSSSGNVEISGSYIGDGSQLTGITTSLPSGLVSGSSQIDHDLTTNYVVNEHIDWTTSQTSSIHPDNYITGSGGVSGDYVPISGSTDITGSISIYDSGSTVLTVSGSSGELMTVNDDITYVSGSLINVFASGSEVFSMDEGGSTYTTGQYNLRTLNLAPSTASDSGTLGEIRFTSTHIYVCTATNTWKRVAIATW